MKTIEIEIEITDWEFPFNPLALTIYDIWHRIQQSVKVIKGHCIGGYAPNKIVLKENIEISIFKNRNLIAIKLLWEGDEIAYGDFNESQWGFMADSIFHYQAVRDFYESKKAPRDMSQFIGYSKHWK